jgi:tRNA(fMet)-specific endonuclease VapC
VSKELGDQALDTNAIIAYRRGDPLVAAWIENCAAILFPVVVVGELEYGAFHSARPEENLQAFGEFFARGTVLDISRATARRYAQIRHHLAVEGKPIPEADLWIAAQCLENDLALLTEDSHIELVPGLTRYSWITPLPS